MTDEIKSILTTKEVADLLRLHPSTVTRYAQQGKIPSIQIGRVYRFKRSELNRFLDGSEVLVEGESNAKTP